MTVSEPDNAQRADPEQPPVDSQTTLDGQSVPNETHAAAVASTSEADAEAGTSTTEGLPEWEPLTPELVEDEAIRGDFMLRSAVVLLALLFGCRQIIETTTLVHVKTGEFLTAHGFWPPAKDVFSSTAAEHRWVNLSWLWDAVASGLFAIGNGAGLSLATALLVAATWWLLGRTSRANVSTWWSSILGALALLACHSQFSGQPETVTLFGLAATLWLLHAWSESAEDIDSAAIPARPVSLWWLVPGFALWSNLDNRMFLGLLALLLWGLGELLGNCCGRGALAAAQRKQFWIIFGACVGASLLNPFGWQSLLSPVVLYGTEYPALRAYVSGVLSLEDLGPFPLWSPSVWATGHLPIVSGLVVLASAAVSLCLNFRNARWSDVLLLAGMAGLALFGSHELAAASVVACVIGSLNAQQWYRTKFRQSYSIETSELLFTRGGRAVTVLALFVLAVLAVNQRLFGVDGKRVGLGMSANLQLMIDGYRSAVAESFDDRPFNFTPRQGDVLIWLDQKPFMDSRVAVFAGRGESDLLALYDRTRRSLAAQDPREEAAGKSLASSGTPLAPASDVNSDDWKPTFERLQITHVLPRLVGVRPKIYFKLLTSPDWQLTYLGAMCAVLYRADAKHDELGKYLGEHRMQFIKNAMQTESPITALRSDWPRPRTAFQKYVSPPETRIPNATQEADNLLTHLNAMNSGQLSIDHPTAVAIATLAIRKANVGLTESPDQPLAYQVLGDAYSFLLFLESEVLRGQGLNVPNEMRFNQALAAYHQAVVLEPNSANLRLRFMQLLQQHNRIDLALRELTVYERLTEDVASSDPGFEQTVQQTIKLKEQWLSQQDTLREQIEKVMDTGADPLLVAQQTYQAGFVLEALTLLDRNLTAVRESPQAQVLRGLLLFESGQIEQAYSQFEYESETNFAAWRLPAAWARLAHGEYDRAISLWNQQIDMGQQQVMSSLLTSLPLTQSPLQILGQPSVWPVQHTAVVGEALFRKNDEQTSLLWYIAMSQLESGKPQLASKTLHGILDENPETFLRPLIRFYLLLITDERIDAEPPSEWIPIEGDMFAPDGGNDE